MSRKKNLKSPENRTFTGLHTLLSLAISQALLTSNIDAAQVTVTHAGDRGELCVIHPDCTLREAVNSINQAGLIQGCTNTGDPIGTNDRIVFDSTISIIDLSYGRLEIDNHMIIDGGNSGVTINGNKADRLFNIDSGSPELELNNLILTGGSSTDLGGAVAAAGGTVTLSNTTVTGNTANQGGGVFVFGSNLVINDSVISNNLALQKGGGVYIFGGSMNMHGSDITENNSSSGGAGIYANSTNIELMNTLVSKNLSTGPGGGIYAKATSLTLAQGTVMKNQSSDGGGFHLTSSSLYLKDATISENNATSGGGGYAINSRLRIRTSTLSGNLSLAGGGLFLISSTSTLYNSTVSSNLAQTRGGGFAAYAGSVVLFSTTVSNNSARLGDTSPNAEMGGGGFYQSLAGVNFINSIVANSFGDDCVQNGQISADSSNIIEDGSCNTDALNVNPKLGVLTNNGGLTLTHALLAGSPAINAGINQHCEQQLIDNLDQTGKSRDVGNACDIGSVEFLPSTLFVVPLANGKTVIFEL